jgi:carboxyl-terminal processing protease
VSKFIKITIISIVLLVVMAVTFGLGIALGGSGLLFEPGVVRAADQPVEFATFWEAWNIIQRRFIDRDALDPTLLTYGAVRGMVQALGDEGHTVFLTPDELVRQRTDISGKFSGIGAQLGVEDSLPVIVAPFDGSPADKAGIKAGDIIINVDGEDVTTLPLNEIVERIRGPEGTQVTLTVLRPEESRSLDITITRGEIDVPAATWAMIPGTEVALIRLSQFSANAADNIEQAVTEAKAAGRPV